MSYLRLIILLPFITISTISNSYCQKTVDSDFDLKVLTVKKIWSSESHNAFTDLVLYKNNWYCVFREATTHKSFDGKIRIISSSDLNSWQSSKVFSVEEDDLRDPKFSITSQGYLLLNFNQRFENNKNGHYRQSITWLTEDGEKWEGPYVCESGIGTWRWSVTWFVNMGYSVGYSGKDRSGTLYITENGKKWFPYIKNFFPLNSISPSETSLVFDNTDSTAYCLLRTDGGSKFAMLGSSPYPYLNWEWIDLKVRIGGPKMVQLDNGMLIAVVRLYDERERTSVCLIDKDRETLTEMLTLPSGGDTSYGGVVIDENIIYISYYSSHEGSPSIYLAKLKY